MRLSSNFTLTSHASLVSRLLASVSLVALAACGGGGDGPPVDAAVKDIGFTHPVATLKANHEDPNLDNSWIEDGPADLSCLGTASADVANTNAVVVETSVEDFQSGNLVPGTTVTVFKDQNVGMPEGAAVVSASTDAKISVTIPVGTKRFGYKMVNPNALDTLLLNQTLTKTGAMGVNTTPQMVGRIQSVSTSTGDVLPALIGVSRTPGTGVLAGAVRDCQNHEISNFIATVSTTPDVVTHLEGVDAYYFSPSGGLPVRHTQQRHGSKDGLFMAIEMNPTSTAYVQIWGYPTQADLDSDTLKLIAQLKTQVIANTVITGSYEPLRTGL